MKYQLIYADPPWQYRDKCNSGKRGSCHKYSVMRLEDICALPISQISAPDCLLAMWWVPPQPAEALAVVSAWGFRLVNMKGFTWVKSTKRGKLHFGMGHWTRGNSEDCLFAVRGRPKRIDAGISQLVHAKVGRHSEKPGSVRDLLVRLAGDVPRIELFARDRVPGWDAAGLDVDDGLCISDSLRMMLDITW